MDERPTFYFDYSSPYAYLTAERVNSVMPEPPVWQPISFGFVLRATGRTPWSLTGEREEGMREIERRAAERGLPALRWPRGWGEGESVAEAYALTAPRAGIFAKASGRAVAFSLAAFRQAFAGGRDLSDPENVLIAAAACELHPRAVLTGIETESVKRELQRETEVAIERGVVGVPTIAVGDELFWGDDRLEEAAERVSAN